MRNRVTSHLWVYLTLLIFFQLILTTLSFIAIIYVLSNMDIIHPGQIRPWRVLLLYCIFSIAIGTAVTGFVFRRVLKPIMVLRTNMEKVAKRDFSIYLDQKQSIKEVQELYTSFNTMVEELNSVEQLRSEFTSTVSHEFRTPVSTIKGYVQLLQNPGLIEEKRQDYYSRILHGTQQLSTLADNILNLTKLGNDHFILNKQHFRLDEQIRQVILFLQPQWENRKLDWTIDLDTVYINGDEEFLYQVWLNLIDNAIKYNEQGGEIMISLRKEKVECFVEIVDTGIGMTEETLKKMFDKFYQEDSTRKMPGNGLGLSLVKRIVNVHGGEITAESSSGSGSKFCIQIPLE